LYIIHIHKHIITLNIAFEDEEEAYDEEEEKKKQEIQSGTYQKRYF